MDPLYTTESAGGTLRASWNRLALVLMGVNTIHQHQGLPQSEDSLLQSE